MHNKLCLLALISLMILYTLPIQASQQGSPSEGAQGGPPPRGGPREACMKDAQTFCQDVQPGGGRIKDCLEDHYKDISDACYAAMKEASSHQPPPPPPSDENEPKR